MKNGKNSEKTRNIKYFQVFWSHTQNLRRFPGFVVVVEVKMFDEILDVSFFFFLMCLFLEENPTNLGVPLFPQEKVTFYWAYHKKVLPTKIDVFLLMVSSSNNNYSSTTLNHSTTTTRTTTKHEESE